ncbi:hypothetical protein COA07_16325 [Sphingomonas adhaesiva]|uniref:Uncharacterized protein n=2 Tax=Sphingomonas adhaesiva TaxID=28212 RepID=A0A2A4I4Q4_9SPHN|nr:hypothetical protein COA07_16325 [Sphingomonas adhaesiva]
MADFDAQQSALEHHPNRAAYMHGGMLAERGFGTEQILPVLGFHSLDWSDALTRLEASTPVDGADLLDRLLIVCTSDPMLEVSGERVLHDLGLLKRGRVDPFWLKRPKLGLGQAAKAFGLTAAHIDGHRGLYVLAQPTLRRLLERAAVGQADQRFGAVLLTAIGSGGEPLAAIGAAAYYRDAEARYRADCDRFADHQRRHPGRRWRLKPALSRQGHLAITTARQKDIAVPAERMRGHAADWLANQNANLRFNGGDEA